MEKDYAILKINLRKIIFIIYNYQALQKYFSNSFANSLRDLMRIPVQNHF